MFKLIIFLIIFYIVFLYPFVIYWVKKMKDPWQARFIFGKMGVGKTGLIAKSALKDLQDPTFKRVYTTIGVPGTYKFDFRDVVENYKTFPPESSVYVDEFGLVYNSRDFKTYPEQARKWMKYVRQSRIKLTMYSQAPDIDKSIRDLCHSYALLRRMGPFVLEFEVSKNIDVGSDMQGNGQLIDNYFKLGLIGGCRIHWLPRYFDLWKSFDPPTWDECAADLVPVTPALYKAFSFRKSSIKNLKIVYQRQLGRVSAGWRWFHHKFIKNNFLITEKQFFDLQLSD